MDSPLFKGSGSYHPDMLYLLTTASCGFSFWVCGQVSRATRPCLALEDKANHSLLVSSASRVNQLIGTTVSKALHTLFFSLPLFSFGHSLPLPRPTQKLLSLQPGYPNSHFLLSRQLGDTNWVSGPVLPTVLTSSLTRALRGSADEQTSADKAHLKELLAEALMSNRRSGAHGQGCVFTVGGGGRDVALTLS